jgi:hypothetical protein
MSFVDFHMNYATFRQHHYAPLQFLANSKEPARLGRWTPRRSGPILTSIEILTSHRCTALEIDRRNRADERCSKFELQAGNADSRQGPDIRSEWITTESHSNIFVGNVYNGVRMGRQVTEHRFHLIYDNLIGAGAKAAGTATPVAA